MNVRSWLTQNNWQGKFFRSTRILWRATLLCLIGFIIAAVGWIGIRPEDFPAAHLEPSPESLVIGETWMQSELHIPVTVRNRSSRSIHIRRFELSHWDMDVVPTSMTIPAGATAQFELQLNASSLNFNDGEPVVNEEFRPFELLIRPVTNWGRVPLPWRFHGTVRSVPADCQAL